MNRVVINDDVALTIAKDPSLRQEFPCLGAVSEASIKAVTVSCSACAAKRRHLMAKRHEVTKAVKMCLYEADTQLVEKVKKLLNATSIVIYIDDPAYQQRTVK